MKEKNNLSCFITRIKKDYIFRTYLFASMSLLLMLIFSCYNVYLGITLNTSWNISISVYYAFLLLIKAVVLLNEKNLYKSNLSFEVKNNKIAKFYLIQSIMLFIIDLLLIAPITILVLQKKKYIILK